jgi:hypothetical protein
MINYYFFVDYFLLIIDLLLETLLTSKLDSKARILKKRFCDSFITKSFLAGFVGDFLDEVNYTEQHVQ